MQEERKEEEEDEGGDSDGDGGGLGRGEVPREGHQLRKEARPSGAHARHLRQLIHDHDQRHTREITDQDRPREEIGDEAQPGRPRHHAQQPDRDRQRGRQYGISPRIPGGDRRDHRGGHQRGRRLRPDRQQPRRAEQRVQHQSGQNRPQTGDRRQPRHGRVRHDLRHEIRHDGHTRQQVAAQPGALVTGEDSDSRRARHQTTPPWIAGSGVLRHEAPLPRRFKIPPTLSRPREPKVPPRRHPLPPGVSARSPSTGPGRAGWLKHSKPRARHVVFEGQSKRCREPLGLERRAARRTKIRSIHGPAPHRSAQRLTFVQLSRGAGRVPPADEEVADRDLVSGCPGCSRHGEAETCSTGLYPADRPAWSSALSTTERAHFIQCSRAVRVRPPVVRLDADVPKAFVLVQLIAITRGSPSSVAELGDPGMAVVICPSGQRRGHRRSSWFAKTTKDQAVAAGHSVGVERWQAMFEGLMERVAGRFARVAPRRRARSLAVGGSSRACDASGGSMRLYVRQCKPR